MNQLRESIKKILTPTVKEGLLSPQEDKGTEEGSLEKALTGAELKNFPKAMKRLGKRFSTPVRYRKGHKRKPRKKKGEAEEQEARSAQ